MANRGAELSKNLYELSGKDQKKYLAAYKIAAEGQVMMDTAKAIMGTWAGYSSMGPWGVAGAIAQTALIGATSVTEMALINRAQAHSGLDFVPETGSYVLKKGELVADPGTSEGVRRNLLGASASSPNVSVTIHQTVSGIGDADLLSAVSRAGYQAGMAGALEAVQGNDPRVRRSVQRMARG
jgi:hypothetical protein